MVSGSNCYRGLCLITVGVHHTGQKVARVAADTLGRHCVDCFWYTTAEGEVSISFCCRPA